MPELICAARRIGDQESRTEEYEIRFAVGEAETRVLEVKYQAARAFEINAALDAATEKAIQEALLVDERDWSRLGAVWGDQLWTNIAAIARPTAWRRPGSKKRRSGRANRRTPTCRSFAPAR